MPLRENRNLAVSLDGRWLMKELNLSLRYWGDVQVTLSKKQSQYGSGEFKDRDIDLKVIWRGS